MRTVRLLTHLVVREDAHSCTALAPRRSGACSAASCKVSGVGPRIALAILSGITVGAFAACVQARDVAALTRIPGVGRKIAERLIVEMRDRLAAGLTADGHAAMPAAPVGVAAEAFSALVALGLPAERGHALAQERRSRSAAPKK